MSIALIVIWIIGIHSLGSSLCDVDPSSSSSLNDEHLLLNPSSELKIYFNSVSSSSSPLSTVDGYFILITNNFTDQQMQNDTLTILVLGEDQVEESSILASCSFSISDVLSKLAPTTTTTTNLTINWSFENHSDLYCTISDHLRNELVRESSQVKSRRFVNDYHIDIKFSSVGNCIKQFHICQDPVKFKTNCKDPPSLSTSSAIYSPEKDSNSCFSKLQYDPLCCPACIGNCSQSRMTASDAVPPSDPLTLPTTSLLFPTSLPISSSTDPLAISFPTPPVFPVTKSTEFGVTKSHNNSSLINPVGNSSSTINVLSNTLPIPAVNASDRPHSLADHCLPNPCLNNQSCKVKLLNESLPSNQLLYLCDCKYPFSGDRCQHFDHCLNDTCKNGATCQLLAPNEIQNATKFYKCVCPAGLAGEFCDSPVLFPPLIVTSSPRVTAVHHVNVTETETTSTETSTSHSISISATETQEPSIIAQNVTIQTAPHVSPCHPNPCLHNGTCEIIKSADYSLVHKCICHPEYEGNVNCSVRRKSDILPPVSPAILLSTSTTSTTTTTAIQISTTEATTPAMTLETTPPTTVTTTAIIATISTDKLLDCSTDVDCNRGRCINGKCNCTGSGYEGLHCEKDIDECDLALCHNQSTCENTPGSYKCNCLAGFSGHHCDIPSIIPVGNSGQSHSEEKNTSTSTSDHDGGGVGGVVGGIIGGIVILCLIIGAFFLYKYISRSRKLKGKYNPAKEEMNNIGGHPVPLATLNTGERLI